MQKLNLSDIKKGSLVNEIKDKTVDFIHNGEEYSVDIRIKTLPFIETESLFTRWDQGKGENVVAEWISKSLVDKDGKLEFDTAAKDLFLTSNKALDTEFLEILIDSLEVIEDAIVNDIDYDKYYYWF